MDSRDVPYYAQFTALNQVFDPGPTQSTFSDIAASASNGVEC